MITLSKKLREARNEQNNNKKLDSCDSLRRRPMIRDTLLIKEVQDLERNLPQNCKIKFPNAHELHKIELYISPDDTYWHGGKFKFIIDVPVEYNILPPKVKCLTKIWHPNISEDGDICLSLLRESSIDGMGWAPTRTLKDVVWGLNSLFTDLLNFDDPLNDEAAQHYRENKDTFRAKVKEYVQKFAK